MRESGRLDDPSPAQRNGLKIRGNPEIRRRRGISVLSTGQPGNATRTEREDAGGGATRYLIGRQNETMHDPLGYTIIRKAPEAARSLALSILGEPARAVFDSICSESILIQADADC